jgi:hypothetical protein
VNKVYDVPCEHRIHVIEDADQETVDCLPQVDWTPLVVEGLTQIFSFTSEDNLTNIQWSINGELVGISDTLSIGFSEFGEYELCLSASNSCSSQEWCETININCTTSAPELVWSQDLLSLSLALTNTYDSVHWSMGDGNILVGDSVQHTYEESGTYTLCVGVFDQCGSDSLCWEIEMSCPAPMADFYYELNGLELEATSLAQYSDSLIWTWNGVLLSNETSVFFQAEAGVNDLCLFTLNTCGVDSFCATLDISPLGLEEIQEHYSLTFYPNPAKEEVKISWNAQENAPLTLTILDLNGREVLIRTAVQRQDEKYLSLDIRHLGPGIYLLEAQWSSGQVSRISFAKE